VDLAEEFGIAHRSPFAQRRTGATDISLAIPKRFAAFLLSLFSSNSDVLELSIIHLQQLSPLAVSLTP